MTVLLSQLEFAVLLGVVAAVFLVLLTRVFLPQREMVVYGVSLVLTAIAYVLFGLHAGAPSDHLALETVGAILYTAAAIIGIRLWPMLLALGWTAHVAWDLFFHVARGAAFAPLWYPFLCVGFDLFLGGYIAGVVSRQSRLEERVGEVREKGEGAESFRLPRSLKQEDVLSSLSSGSRSEAQAHAPRPGWPAV